MQKSKIQVKIQNLLFKFWPLLFIVIVWSVFASPYFLKNLVPFPSNYLVNFFPPWASYGEFAGPVKNNAMPDIISQIYPWKKLTIDSLKSGEIPFWNPYSFSGNPHLANYQSGVLSPFNLIFFILPFVDAWSVLILLAPLLSGFFTYLLMRSLNVSKLGSTLGGIVFMFCGFMVVWMAYGTLSYAILYLPLAFYAIQNFANSKKIRYLILLSLTIPFSFFSGHFQISFYFLISIFVFLLFRIYKETLKTKFFLTTALFTGILLSMPQLLPSWELYTHSIRKAIFRLTETVPIGYIITSFAPDFYGNAVTRNDWYGHYAEWASFVGIISLILATISFLKPKKEIIFFGILGLASLLLSLQTPLAELIINLKIPVVSTSALSRIIVIFSFSAAVLAGYGLDILKEYIVKSKSKRIIVVFSAWIVFIFLIWTSLFFFPLLPPEKILIAKRNMILPTLILTLGSLTVLTSFYIRKFALVFLFGLLILTSLDSLRFAQKWMPFDPKKYVFPTPPVVKALQKETRGVDRVFGNIGGELVNYYKLPGVEGYDPLYIERYGEFLRSGVVGHFAPPERSVVKLGRSGENTDKIIDLLGASVIFHPNADTGQEWAYPVWKNTDRFVPIYKDGSFQLYRNNTALERAKLFYDFEIIRESEKIVNKFYETNFEFRDKLILEEDPKVKKVKIRPKGVAKVTQYGLNNVRIISESENPAVLFLADNYYPGWKAYLDGAPVKILRADYSFRAISVPEGKHFIEFTYFPASFRYGVILAGTGLLIIIGILAFGRKTI